jgi:hypothetical protein
MSFSWMRGVRTHEAWLLPLVRGLVNALAVAFVLRQAAQPLAVALAEGCAAGVQSALLPITPVNARYARFLADARSELERFARWGVVSTVYLTVMQLAGSLAAARPEQPLLLAAFIRAVLGAGQYPWVAALALRRQHNQRRRCPQRRDQLRFAADVETMAVSAAFVSLTALQALGLPAVRPVLVAAGLCGLVRYLAIKQRRSVFGLVALPESSSHVMPVYRRSRR